jgi:hypothetical protein
MSWWCSDRSIPTKITASPFLSFAQSLEECTAA